MTKLVGFYFEHLTLISIAERKKKDDKCDFEKQSMENNQRIHIYQKKSVASIKT